MRTGTGFLALLEGGVDGGKLGEGNPYLCSPSCIIREVQSIERKWSRCRAITGTAMCGKIS